MGSKLRKNAIMTGYLNSYCLVCECYFDTDEDTGDHIKDIDHTDKLLAHPYLEKYGDNHIRKVNRGYFCEFCSILLATAVKISLHVQESTHYTKKGTFLLHRPNGISAVIAFDDLLIDERAWHSLSEDACAICNEEFDNESIHKTGSGHLLKLVQNKVEFGPGNNLYRETDDSSFQCLTCNAVFALSELNNHFTEAEHKKLYAKCQEKFKKYTELNKAKIQKIERIPEKLEDVRKDDVKGKKNYTKEKINDAKDKINDAKDKKNDAKDEKDDVKDEIDDVKDKKNDVKDKKCDDTEKNVDDKSKKVDNKKADDNDKENSVDTKHNDVTANSEPTIATIAKAQDRDSAETPTNVNTETDEITAFANAHKLTYNTGITNSFCRVCKTKLPATLRSMKEHVNGKEHKNRLGRETLLSQAAKVNSQTRKPMGRFINHCVNIENVFHQDVVINAQYCLSVASFLMLTRVGARYRCQVCEVTVFEDDMAEHSNLPRHERAMESTPVITSLPQTEFIREVRLGIFHCGYCNLIIPKWEEVESHLHSREHQNVKDACVWRMQRHLPMVLEHRRRQEVNQMDAMDMFLMRRFFQH